LSFKKIFYNLAILQDCFFLFHLALSLQGKRQQAMSISFFSIAYFLTQKEETMRQIFWYGFLVILFVNVFTYSQRKERKNKDAVNKEVVIQKGKSCAMQGPF
jgi:hypothetical protein